MSELIKYSLGPRFDILLPESAQQAWILGVWKQKKTKEER